MKFFRDVSLLNVSDSYDKRHTLAVFLLFAFSHLVLALYILLLTHDSIVYLVPFLTFTFLLLIFPSRHQFMTLFLYISLSKASCSLNNHAFS